jgi:hypothetical protein
MVKREKKMKRNKIIERLVEITEKNTLLNNSSQVNKEQVNKLLKEHNFLINQLNNNDSDSSSELSPEDIKNLQEALKDSDNESDFKTPQGSVASSIKKYGKEGNDFGTSKSASDASIEKLKNSLQEDTSEKDTKKTRKTRKRKSKAGSPIKKNTSVKKTKKNNKKSSSSKSKKGGAPSKNTRSSSMKLRSNKLIKKANTTIKKKKLHKPQNYTYFESSDDGHENFYKKLDDKNLKNGDTISYITNNQLGLKIYKVVNGKPKLIQDGADYLSENSTNSSVGGGVLDSIKGVFSTRKKCKNEHSKNYDCETSSIYTKLRNKKIAIKQALQKIKKDRDDKLIEIKGKDYKKSETNKDKIMKSIFGNEDDKIELTEKEEKDLFDDSISKSRECNKKKQIAIDSCVESKK